MGILLSYRGKPTIYPGSGRKMMRKKCDKLPQDSTSRSFKRPYSVSDKIVQSLSHVQLFATPWTTAHQASQYFTISQEFAQMHVH